MTRKSKWILIVSIFVFVVDLLWYSIYFCGGGVFFLIAGIVFAVLSAVLIFVSGWFNRKKDVCKGKHYAIAKHFEDNAIHYLLK